MAWIFIKQPLDFVGLARSFDIQGVRVERPEDLAPTLREAMDSGATRVVDVILDDSFDAGSIQEAWGQWWVGR